MDPGAWTAAVQNGQAPCAADQIAPPCQPGLVEPVCAPCPDEFAAPYSAMLEFLVSHGLLEGLPLTAEGRLHISVPFCGHFFECSILLPWLAQRIGSDPCIRGAAIHASDVCSWPEYGWPGKERWAAERFPEVELHLSRLDLTKERARDAGLTLGLHPQATFYNCARGEVWYKILTSTLHAAQAGGVCLFPTFTEVEAEVVARVVSNQGVGCQVLKNPFYEGRETPPGAPLRFLVLARPGAQEQRDLLSNHTVAPAAGAAFTYWGGPCGGAQ